MTSVVMSDSGGNIVEYVTVMEDPQQVGSCPSSHGDRTEGNTVWGSSSGVPLRWGQLGSTRVISNLWTI